MEGVSEGGVNGGGVQMFQSAFGASPSSIPKPHNLGGPDNGTNKRIGIPPSHPNNSQIMASRSINQQAGSQNLTRGPSHSRSLSQSAMFSLDCLPPLNSSPYQSSVSNQPAPVLTDVQMEDRGGVSHGVSVPSANAGANLLRVNESLPPRRRHRRSMSDSVPLAFSAVIQSSPQLIPIGSQGGLDRSASGRESSGLEKQGEFVKWESEWNRDVTRNVEGISERKSEGEVVDDLLSAYMNFENIDPLNSSGTEDKDLDSRASGTKTNGAESSDNEVESQVKRNPNSIMGTSMVEKREGLKRNASEDIAPSARHYRSLSMDSYMGNLNFDDESLKQPPVGTQTGQLSHNNSMDGNLTKFNLEFGNGEFNEMELKKILANEKLTEIAMTDPKRAKRILANRLSAARSKERKMHYISELEQKVQTLQTEATTLSAQVTVLQRDSASLTSQNNELKFRLQAMEQQAQLKDAINEQLMGEVQRLRLSAAELGDALHQLPANLQMLQLQNQQSTQLSMYQLQQQKKLQQQAQPNQNGEVGNQLK